MKKRLLFLYRYFTASQRGRRTFKRWVNTQTLMIIVVSFVFLTTLAWTAPYSIDQQLTPTPSVVVTPTLDPDGPPARTTPLPAEYLSNDQQTIGISIGATMLVLIVVIGVIAFMPRKAEP